MRLYLSVRQPHTVSVLVVGDLDRALRDGDYDHVRVAVLIEAATVEPDGARAKVRVARAGLFSARPEILAPTARMIDALREEHRFIVSRPEVAEFPGFAKLVDEDGAIRPQGDAESLAALREVLCRLQLRQWRDAVRYSVPARRITSDEELGRWFAQTMASTGILDAAWLEALLLVPHPDGGWTVDPERIDGVLAEPRLALERFDAREDVPVIPAQPFVASEVDADLIERFIGWKRFLRMAQVIPDTRGKDVDLAFDDQTLTARTGAWWQRARAMAAERPGEVMVVVAGDGLNPARESGASALLGGHRDALLDPNLRYLRIQHAQGTHLSWLKDVLQVLSERPGGAPVSMQWEAAHGSSVNVMLIAVRDPDVPERPWSLEGWTVESCTVLISELKGIGARDYRIGLFTEPMGPDRRVNPELLHFGRAHCEGLLAQGGPRVTGTGDDPMRASLEGLVMVQIAGWTQRVRGAEELRAFDEEHRARRVAALLGLTDVRLARALAEAATSNESPVEVARRIWGSVPAWRPVPQAAEAASR